MKDIPVAVLRQTRLPARDLAAGVRASIAVNSAGALVAMLLTPLLLRYVDPAAVLFLCGSALIVTAGIGLFRYWTTAKPSHEAATTSGASSWEWRDRCLPTVAFSSSASSCAPTSTTVLEIQIQVMKPTTAPSDPYVLL